MMNKIMNKGLQSILLILVVFFIGSAELTAGSHWIENRSQDDVVPHYLWTCGCTPTAAMMVLGYYDYDKPTFQFFEYGLLVERYMERDKIRNYTDQNGVSYRPNPDGLPEDTIPMTAIYDLARAMGTRASDGATQVGYYIYNVKNGILKITNNQRGYAFTAEEWYTTFTPDSLWATLKNEINNNRPCIWSCNKTTSPFPFSDGHSVCVVGYTDDNEIICHTTWNTGWHAFPYKDNGQNYAHLVTVHPGGGRTSDLEVKIPDGGEVWEDGNTKNITWLQEGYAIDNVEIYYSTNGGYTYKPIATASSTQGTNRFTWTVPALSTAHVFIFIQGWNGSNNLVSRDSSMNRFTIKFDQTPPTPNPLSWSALPYQASTSLIRMEATTASDPSTPIEYFFNFFSSPTGGSGGTDSGWQPNTAYTDSNLQANHRYGYRIKARDNSTSKNETSYSAISYEYTDIEPSQGVSSGSITSNSIQVKSSNTPSGLARGSSGLMIENETKGVNSGWKNNNDYWTATGLTPNTRYSFKAKTRNGDGEETAFSDTSKIYTFSSQPGAASFSSITINSIQANWTANGNPSGTYYYCENTTRNTNSGWTMNTSWNSTGLTCATSYSFRVKSRNVDGVETSWTNLGTQSTPQCAAKVLNAPHLVSPFNGATGQQTTLNIQWQDTNNSPQEQGYKIRLKAAGGNYTYYSTPQNATSYSISGLTYNKTYYWNVQAMGNGTSTQDSTWANSGTDWYFATANEVTIPTVSTKPVTSITQNSAVSGGNVLSDGGAAVTVRGICWSKSPNPTTADLKTTDGSGLGDFTSHITSLDAGTTYHVRAYATNSKGTAYGSNEVFTTAVETTLPTVSTDPVSSITQNSAVCGGNVTSDGGAAVTARGVCWSQAAYPTTDNSRTIDGSGLGSFTSNITGLNPGITYHVRAYATNSKGTAYGSNEVFTTAVETTLPTVSTDPLSSITPNSAVCGGNVTSDGGAAVTARGVCWSQSAYPTTDNSRTIDGSGLGSFTSNITGLNPGITYHVRAYATNSNGTAYGSDRVFTTAGEITLPTVSTNPVSSITQDSAVCGGNVTSDGGAAVTARGVCWSKAANPTIYHSKTDDGSGLGSFTSYITPLDRAVTYYVRAYATNSKGTSYGAQHAFTTSTSVTLPIVSTAPVSSITSTSAVCGGNVTSDGGAAVTARGVCWSQNRNPTVYHSKTINGSGVGSFTSNIQPLSSSTAYFVRAYATNNLGTAYGNEREFTTDTTERITVTIPNGGESWKVASTHNITWSVTGNVENVKIEYSTDNGGSWRAITTTAANGGSYRWKVPNTPSSRCLVKVSDAADGRPSDTGNSTFSIVEDTQPPQLFLNRNVLHFCCIHGGNMPGEQTFTIDNIGGGLMDWTIDKSNNALSVTPSKGSNGEIVTVFMNPAGYAVGSYVGELTVSAPGAINSVQPVRVYLTVKNAKANKDPIGYFETPANHSTVMSSISVSGWVVDDTGIKNVKIYRGSSKNPVYIGEAVFVDGARSDIEALYPTFPGSYKAGWGYLLLTNFLPNRGNGTFTLHAIATDSENKPFSLGTKTIFCDNANAVKPFGAIDTPAQGGTVSGAAYPNWGWVLTPQPDKIPESGSTISVWVDGVQLDRPEYGIYRPDIAGLFPGYANSQAAVGLYFLDTTVYKNGVHSIHWLATDTGNDTDGIGSRFFNILNSHTSGVAGETSGPIQKGPLAPLVPIKKIPAPSLAAGYKCSAALLPAVSNVSNASIRIVKGYKEKTVPREVSPDSRGVIKIHMNQLERIQLNLGSQGDTENRAFQVVGDRLTALPIGSTFDKGKGIFYWQVGPGFIGNYEFLFLDSKACKRVKITIAPK